MVSQITSFKCKWSVRVISSGPQCKDDYAQVTKVTLKPVSDQ